MHKNISIITSILVATTILSGMVQSGAFDDGAFAESATITTTISVSSACSMNSNVTSSHSATLIPGVYSGSYNDGTSTPYANGIGSTTLTTICNDNDGYAIYAVGYTGNTTASGNTNLVGTTTGATIATGTNTSGDTSNWAMKLTKVTDTNVSYNPNNLTIESDTSGTYSDYHIVPSDYTKVASYSSTTDTTKGSKLTTTYAAYIGPSQAADTYVGQVKYVLVHPSTNDTNSFIINFNPNGGTGTMTPQKITIGQATTLTSNSFTAPANKVFNGWNTSPDGTGTSYTNGEQVTNLASAGTTITLYAQCRGVITFDMAYEQAGKTKHNGYYTMQDATSAICTAVDTGQTGTLIDTRDDTTYRVAKLADDRCWMLENLNLAGGTALSADDTDVTSEYISGFTTQNRLTKDGDTIVLPDSSISGFSTAWYAYVYNSGNKTDCGASGQSTPCYSYYSWIAAVLGGKRDDGITTETRQGYNAAASICPKGWRLPKSTTSNANPQTSPNWKTGDWYALATAYGANLENSYSDKSSATGKNFYNNAGPGTTPNFLLAGENTFGTLSTPGTYGYYWSATYDSSDSAYDTFFSQNYIHTSYRSNYNCRQGESVRCIMR